MSLAKLHIDGLRHPEVAVDTFLLHEISNRIDMPRLELGHLGRGFNSVFFCQGCDAVVGVWL
jgi:hypothetical protein